MTHNRLILTIIMTVGLLITAFNISAAQSSVSSLLNVQMYNGNTATTINTIFPWFKITNTSSKPIDLSTVRIRYFYTIDGEQPQTYWCDWSSIGAKNVTGIFKKLSSPTEGADYYFEVGFKSSAGSIQPGQNVEVQLRFAKTDWSNYNQLNDYSFNQTAQTYTDTNKIKVLIGDTQDDLSTGNIQGTTSMEDGTICSNADVQLVFSLTGQKFTTITDASGNFVFKDLPLDGVFVITVTSSKGYIGSATDSINQDSPNQDVIVSMAIPDSGVVSGMARTEDKIGVGDANVQLVFPSTGQKFTTTTDTSGVFTFKGLPLAGTFIVNITSVSGYTGSITDSINENSSSQSLDILMTLPGSGSVTGHVLTADGKTVPNAVVTIVFMESEYTATVTTDTNGAYTFTGIPTDGSLLLVAFDPETAATGDKMSYLTSSVNTQSLDLTVKVPSIVNEDFSNGDFSDGTFNGWETEGDAQIVPSEEVFGENSSSTTTENEKTEESISTVTINSNVKSAAASSNTTKTAKSSGVISTAGDNRAVGKESHSFKVAKNMDTLVGKVRFLTDEYPEWYGSQYNDSYTVYLSTSSGTVILAKGNLNTTSWGAGANGFNAAALQKTCSRILKKYIGQKVTLTCEVSDIGDTYVDSGLAISDFMIKWKDNRIPVETGSWSGDEEVNMELGSSVWITVKNDNILGTTVTMEGFLGNMSVQGRTDAWLAPGQSYTFHYTTFAEDPVSWKFKFGTYADACQVQYTIESDWKPGMPTE